MVTVSQSDMMMNSEDQYLAILQNVPFLGGWPALNELNGWILDLQCLRESKFWDANSPASGIITVVSHAMKFKKQHVANASLPSMVVVVAS